MRSFFFEATNGILWGKFMVGRFEPSDWAATSKVDPGRSLLRGRGWDIEHHLVLDLQTGQGAMFPVRSGGVAEVDVVEAEIWVCPMFRLFLQWLYDRAGSPLEGLPGVVEFPDPSVSATG
jgi:hypothetical protein